VISFLLFPASVALALVLLATHRPHRSINEVFVQHHRPLILKTAVGLWLVAFLAVVIAVNIARLPLYGGLWRELLYSPNAIQITTAVGLVLLLLCEAMVIAYWIVYVTYCWIGLTRYRLAASSPLAREAPGVVVLIPCCDEDAHRLERSISSVARLDYESVTSYLIENSRDPALKATAACLAERHGLRVVHVSNRGRKAGALNEAMRLLDLHEPYLAIIDSDQRVAPEFLRELVPVLEADPGLAFVQTPQLHEDGDPSRLATAASQQEMLPYDSILEGKGSIGRVQCCGTNFVMRLRALKEVGGWDEEGITKEDTATSFRMHGAGWRSCYVQKAYAFGLGPSTLSDYRRLQFKWAFGNTRVFRLVIGSMMGRNRERAPLIVALDYLWTTGFYATTLALAGLSLLPILLWLLPVHAERVLYSYAVLGMVMLFPYFNMGLRGYSVRNLLLLHGLLSMTTSCHLSGVMNGLVWCSGDDRSFSVHGRFRERSIWLSLHPYVFLGFMAAGSLSLRQTLMHPTNPYLWVVLLWLFGYSILAGQYLCFLSTADSTARSRRQ